MARIAGITIPNDKRVEIALTYIFGIGSSLSKKILDDAKVDYNKQVKDLTEKELGDLRNMIEKEYKVEGEKRRETMINIKRLKEIGSYRGTRHSRNLPARGQRTKTNSRTVRGNIRKTAGSGRKAAAQKT